MLLICLFPGDFDGSDNDYDDDNNEYGNSEAKEYGCQHWERKNKPDIAHVKEEKVCIENYLLFQIKKIPKRNHTQTYGR